MYNEDEIIANDGSFDNGQVSHEQINQDPIQPQPQEEERPEVAQAQAPQEVQTIAKPTTSSGRTGYTEEQQNRNFAELRRMHEQNSRELELIRRENESLRSMALSNQPKKDELGIAQDAYVERNHVEKLIDARLREQEDKYRKQLEFQRQQESERSLKAQYKDLYTVLSPENLARLEQEEPEIAASIAANPDIYSAKVAAYKQIKKLGIDEERYNEQRVSERLAQNSQRPKSPANLAPRQGSQALSAASRAGGQEETLTEDMAARYRKEMEDAISRM